MATSTKRNVWQIRVAHSSSWENHEELHFMQDEPPPHFSLPLFDCLVSHFTDWASRINNIASAKSRSFAIWFLFVGVIQRGSDQDQKYLMNRNDKFERLLLLFLLPSYRRVLGVRLPEEAMNGSASYTMVQTLQK